MQATQSALHRTAVVVLHGTNGLTDGLVEDLLVIALIEEVTLVLEDVGLNEQNSRNS